MSNKQASRGTCMENLGGNLKETTHIWVTPDGLDYKLNWIIKQTVFRFVESMFIHPLSLSLIWAPWQVANLSQSKTLFALTINVPWLVDLICIYLRSGRKSEHTEKAHTGLGRTSKLPVCQQVRTKNLVR